MNIGFDSFVANDDTMVLLQGESNVLLCPADDQYISAAALQQRYHTSKEYIHFITLIRRVQDNGQISLALDMLH